MAYIKGVELFAESIPIAAALKWIIGEVETRFHQATKPR